MLSQERPLAVNLPHLSRDKFYQASLLLNFFGKGSTAHERKAWEQGYPSCLIFFGKGSTVRGRPGNEASRGDRGLVPWILQGG